MKRIVIALFLLLSQLMLAQTARYKLIDVVSSNATDIQLKIAVYDASKKVIDHEAACAALRLVLFDGVPKTRFGKPLLSEGEVTCMQEFPSYFENLYSTRYADFVKAATMSSKYRKGDGKSTEYIITVRAIQLRKDLEKNNIRKKLGY